MGISVENPDPSKQAQEFVFSRKIKKPSHLVLILKISINSQFYLKLLGFFFNSRPNTTVSTETFTEK